jgi:hypothetical protein
MQGMSTSSEQRTMSFERRWGSANPREHNLAISVVVVDFVIPNGFSHEEPAFRLRLLAARRSWLTAGQSN